METHVKKIWTCMVMIPAILLSQSGYPGINDFTKNLSPVESDSARKDTIQYSLTSAKSILFGVPSGLILGYLFGKTLSAQNSYRTSENSMIGAVVGMATFPFVYYEIARRKHGICNQMNRWAFFSGTNFAFSDYKGAGIQPGISAGLNRYYYLNERLDIIYGMNFNISQFELKNQIIKYDYWGYYKYKNNDIRFSAGYIDFLLLLNYKFGVGKVKFDFAIGPFISVQALNNTKMTTYWEEYADQVNPDYHYDLYYCDDEVFRMCTYSGFAFNASMSYRRFMVQFRYKNAFAHVDHLYAISPNTQLRVIELSLGFRPFARGLQSARSEKNHISRESVCKPPEGAGNDTTRYSLNPAKSILIGVPLGYLVGRILGPIASSKRYDNAIHGARGGGVGMAVMPFIHYEISRHRHGISNIRNRSAFCFGTNFTYPDYDDAQIQPGFSAGLNRYYYLSNKMDILYGMYYSHHRFRIPEKIIKYNQLYYMWGEYISKPKDILYSAYYLDLLVLMNYKFGTENGHFNLGIGPFISTQLACKNNYDRSSNDKIRGYELDDEYDYFYNENATGMVSYIGYAINAGILFNRFIIQCKYTNAFYKTDHLYAISPNTKLRSIELSLGFFVRK